MKRIIVLASASFDDEDMLSNKLFEKLHMLTDFLIITGAGRPIFQLATKWAFRNNKTVIRYHEKDYKERHKLMIERADAVILFREELEEDEELDHLVRLAKKKKIKIKTYEYEDDWL